MIVETSADYRAGMPPDVHLVRSGYHSKLYRYGQESYYQESSRELRRLLARPLEDYRHYTFVLLKPDALVTRSAQTIVEQLRVSGFEVVTAFRIQFDRYLTRELWRYENNVARVQRYELIDELLCVGPSVMLLLDDTTGALDASARLSAIKGKSNSSERPTNSLRTRIKAREGTLNFIHTPDEFIDLVRETGVILDAPRRATLAVALNGAGRQDPMPLLQAAEQEHPSHSLRMEDLIERFGSAFVDDVAQHREILSEEPYSLKEHFVKAHALTKWDWITLAANTIRFSHSGILPVFDFETAR